MPANRVPSVEAQMAAAKLRLQREMPKEMAATSISPMGGLGQALSGGAEAITNPLTGSIYYNPVRMGGQSQHQVEDTLAHELTHTRQSQQEPWYTKFMAPLVGLQRGLGFGEPYGQHPEELEAYQTEADRAAAAGRTPGAMPQFLPQQSWWQRLTEPPPARSMTDIQLYPNRPLQGLKKAVQ